MYSSTTGAGRPSAGSHSCTASFTPSGTGMKLFSIIRTSPLAGSRHAPPLSAALGAAACASDRTGSAAKAAAPATDFTTSLRRITPPITPQRRDTASKVSPQLNVDAGGRGQQHRAAGGEGEAAEFASPAADRGLGADDEGQVVAERPGAGGQQVEAAVVEVGEQRGREGEERVDLQGQAAGQVVAAHVEHLPARQAVFQVRGQGCDVYRPAAGAETVAEVFGEHGGVVAHEGEGVADVGDAGNAHAFAP